MKVKRTYFLILIFVLLGLIILVWFLHHKNEKQVMSEVTKNIPLNQTQLDTLHIDEIIVLKGERKLMLKQNGVVIKEYKIALGKNPIGDKQFEGDNKTPEGKYSIDGKNPNSQYYKNLGVSYPNEDDIREAATFGKPAGGDIKIHGFENGFKGNQELFKNIDWTAGCISVTNKEMDELYELIDIGTVIWIKP